MLPQGGARRRDGTGYSTKLPGTLGDLTSDVVVTAVAQGAGSTIGDYSQLSELFDDVTSGQYNNRAAQGTTKYGGKDWGLGNTKVLNKVQIYYDSGEPSVRFTVQGSSDNFVSDINDLGATAWLPYTGSAENVTLVLTDTATAYRYHRIKEEAAASANPLSGVYVYEFYLWEQASPATITASDPQSHGGTVANLVDDDDAVICTTGQPGTTDDYVVAQFNLGSSQSIRFVDVKNIYLSGGSGESSDEFNIEYSSSATFASDVNVFGSVLPTVTETTQSARVWPSDATAKSARYWRLIRNGQTDLGTSVVNVGEVRFMEDLGATSAARLVPFEFSTEQVYMLVFTDQNITVIRDGSVIANVDSPFTSSQLARINWSQSADTLIVVHEDVAPWQVQRDTSDEGLWTTADFTIDYVPLHDFSRTTTTYGADANDYVTPSAKTGSITLTLAGAGGSLAWASTHVGQLAELNGGLARITEIQSTTVALAVVLVPLYTDAQDTSWDLITGFEDVWSTSRGWPKSVCFFEGRLWFGGSKSRPHSLWGSKVDDFGDFDSGQGLADEALNVTLDTDQINEIVNIYPGRDLQAFTTGAEFYLPQPLGEPITPETIQIKRQTSRGSEKGLRVAEVEGATLFVQRGGKGVREYLYNEVEQSYNADNISLLSSHLISSPVDFALRRANETNEADQLMVVNTAGAMAVCSTLRTQGITAWTPWEFTGATVKNAAAIRGGENQVYLVTERTIDSTTARYAERMDEDALTDFGLTQAITSTGTAAISNLDHLEGETVAVFINGTYQGSDTISSGATSGTYSLTEGDSVEVGLSWVPTGKTMPVSIDAQGGSIRAKKKRPVEATFFLYDSDDLQCNGNTQTITDGTTGQVVFQGLREYDGNGQVPFTQSNPGKLTILGIDLEVSY
ncbi:MAG: hypothetical protein K0U84_13385 [Actinomycetia bacterium]|nr:hypothetical protein [Actinomycetes bacterium]